MLEGKCASIRKTLHGRRSVIRAGHSQPDYFISEGRKKESKIIKEARSAPIPLIIKKKKKQARTAQQKHKKRRDNDMRASQKKGGRTKLGGSHPWEWRSRKEVDWGKP